MITERKAAEAFHGTRACGLRITLLVENTTPGRGLLGEHGLAVHIQDREESLLFDTGQSGSALLANAKALGVDLGRVPALVLSHGHYDHTGGVRAFLSVARDVDVFLHADALAPSYNCKRGQPPRAIGIPDDCAAALQRASCQLICSPDAASITKRVSTTGHVPRKTDFEDVGGPFFLDPNGSVPDSIESDQALWIRSDEGPIVVLGCAHAGVVNTLNHVAALSGENRIYAVIGGMHLGQASVERLQATAKVLRQYGVRLLSPCHCTGNMAKEFLAQEFASEYVPCCVGSFFSSSPLRG